MITSEEGQVMLGWLIGMFQGCDGCRQDARQTLLDNDYINETDNAIEVHSTELEKEM